MNDLSSNKYLTGRIKPLKDFTLCGYLHGEPVTARMTEKNEMFRAMNSILSFHGFRFQLRGYRYLAELAVRYIVKNEFDYEKEVGDIAYLSGTDRRFVIDNIENCIHDNEKFLPTASMSLDMNIDLNNISVVDAVEILGAVFKIYYNYITLNDTEMQDDGPAVNYHRMVLCNGKQ